MPAKKKTASKKTATNKPSQKKSGKLDEVSAPSTALLCRLKISLLDSEPPVWRTVTVPHDVRLDRLHLVIQEAMGWRLSHLWKIEAGGGEYSPGSEHELFGDDETKEASNHRVREFLNNPGDAVFYIYDLGDDWVHTVELEEILGEGPRKAEVLDGANACPPEDCGGIQGYYQLLETLGDPEHEDHEDMIQWAGGPLDPEAFDLELARKRAERVKV